MRLIRWVESRISGRKSRLKDGSTTSADDQFIYHPSPYRQPLSHIATPAHSNPPKLHYQLEQRINEQFKERLSCQLNEKIIEDNFDLLKRQKNINLRRTASASDSRVKTKIFNRYNKKFDPNAIEKRHTYFIEPCSLIMTTDQEFDQTPRLSSTTVSNESSFFECSTPSLSLIQDCNTSSLGKQRSRIKTNPWLSSSWMSSDTNVDNNEYYSQAENEYSGDNETRNNYENVYETPENHYSTVEIFNQFKTPNNNYKKDDVFQNNDFKRKSKIINKDINKKPAMKNSLSYASTSSSDSGCGVNTNSIEASVISTNNYNESLMSCSMMSNNSFFVNEDLIDEEEEEILTISHNLIGEQVIKQMNVKSYIEQLNSIKNNVKKSSLDIPLQNNASVERNDILEIQRAESQLSAIYQQIDDLKQKIEEIDSDNERIEAKMNCFVKFNEAKQKNSVDIKKLNHQKTENLVFNFDDKEFLNNSSLNDSVFFNSSEEETKTSSPCSPASSSSFVSSPTDNIYSNYNNKTNYYFNDINERNQQSYINKASSNLNSKNLHLNLKLKSDKNYDNSAKSQNYNQEQLIDDLKTEQDFNYFNKTDNTSNNSNYQNNFNVDNLHGSFKNMTFSSTESLISNDVSKKYIMNNSISYNKKRYFNKLNNKFVNSQKSFYLNSTSNPLYLHTYLNDKANDSQSNNKFKKNNFSKRANEKWVSTTTDLLHSAEEESDYDKNKFLIKKNKQVENMDSNENLSLMFNKNKNIKSLNNKIKPLLFSNFTSENYEIDANRFKIESKIKNVQLPLTPIKTNLKDSSKRLRPITGSKIPIMKSIFETELNINQDLSPSPPPYDCNVINYNSNLLKPKPLPFKKLNTVNNCLLSPLTQQLRFEKEQKKANCSFNTNFVKVKQKFILSPPPSSDSGLELTSEESPDNSPVTEQVKNQTLSNQIHNLRSELREVIKVAIDKVKHEEISKLI